MTDEAALRRDVARLAGHRVLVVGDLVLDEYVTGRPTRISREAPVPVLERVDQEDRAGSAASPAANIIALGSQASVVGVVGCDPEGSRLEAALQRLGLHDLERGLLRRPEVPTPTKTRVMAQGYTGGLHGRQQVLRLDRTSVLPEDTCALVAKRVERLAPEYDAVLVSDYRGGVIGASSLAALRAAQRTVTVDSQGDVRRFAGVEILKINQAEAQAAIGHGPIEDGGAALRRELGVRQLVITLGAEGMLVFADGSVQHVPAVGVSEVFDVTGAGDTVIAVLTLGLIGGLEPIRAAQLASAAASVVVRRLGVATASPEEIVAALSG
jgi:D-glycero-beta-D-manno-heptose-7-phosphate kinase